MADVRRRTPLYVVKRDGRHEAVHFDKISHRIQKLCYGLNTDYVDPIEVAQKVISGLFSGVTTVQLDELASETAADMTVRHPDYAILAARISVSNLHKKTKKLFSDVANDLYHAVNPKTGVSTPLLADDVYNIIMANADLLNSTIVHDRDFSYTYFGFKTLERSYLLKINGEIAERPQHMLMRVSIGIHKEDIDAAIETYNYMSERWFTHATPTLFNSGTARPQMSSCFLLPIEADSIEGIFDTVKKCALISKSAGGVGVAVHNIRAKGSPINGTCSSSNGLIPVMHILNNTARYVDQGGNKRPGAFAVYVEPWHPDVFQYLDLRKNFGDERERTRDLFFALWLPDLFMKRIKANGKWSLMCPDECRGLDECWGDEFEKLYEKYESQGKYRKQVEARELWEAIIVAQIETGMPYLVYKDSCNRKSNQQNLGTIKCSNLCAEIVEYCSKDEVAVCNLASIALNRFVTPQRTYDFEKLHKVAKILTVNLNRVIDNNYYPVPEARVSNMRHRPIGLGVQGLADAFMLMKYPYTSPEARELNKRIFETIYHGAIEASCELAEKEGPYETYEGSPASKGILQYDMWGVTPTDQCDWAALKTKIAEHGLRNSLVFSPMPTASTAQILGNNESFEPYTSNVYTRNVLSGNFQIFNPHLMRDLVDLGLWDEDMKLDIIAYKGSIQEIDRIPQHLKELYKTVWEISQKDYLDMAADRGAFVDQSQSLNLFIAKPTYANCTSMHFYAWQKGLKTGVYYLRTRPSVDAVQFTVDKTRLKKKAEGQEAKTATRPKPEAKKFEMGAKVSDVPVCDGEICLMCQG